MDNETVTSSLCKGCAIRAIRRANPATPARAWPAGCLRLSWPSSWMLLPTGPRAQQHEKKPWPERRLR